MLPMEQSRGAVVESKHPIGCVQVSPPRSHTGATSGADNRGWDTYASARGLLHSDMYLPGGIPTAPLPVCISASCPGGTDKIAYQTEAQLLPGDNRAPNEPSAPPPPTPKAGARGRLAFALGAPSTRRIEASRAEQEDRAIASAVRATTHELAAIAAPARSVHRAPRMANMICRPQCMVAKCCGAKSRRTKCQPLGGWCRNSAPGAPIDGRPGEPTLTLRYS